MKGYFARIAEQSGLRYPGGNAETRVLSGGKRTHEPAPLEREETVLVSSSGATENAMAKIERDDIEPSQSGPDQESTQSTGREREPSVSRTAPVQSPAGPATRPVLNEGRADAGPDENRKKSAAVMEVSRMAPNGVAKVDTAITQAASGGLEHSGTERERTRRADGLDSMQPRVAKPADPLSRRGSESAPYFAKTAEIIEKGKTGAEDAQTILLREVHEWVASSPAEASAEHDETPPSPEAVRPIEQRVAILRESDREERAERARPVEQSFELSIGTISVIVEEPEKPRQPEAPARRPGNAVAKENEPRFSRLGRSYL
jgi:hypothetical protein